jgi:dipeptidyl aminopeptidase/acylaminoacyl peptidase
MRVLKFWIGTAVLIALPTFYSSAQSGSSINGPSLGFVSNENGTKIWPLLGILGAAVPGQPLVLPESITNAAISPQHDYTVATSTATGQPVIIRLGIPDPVSLPVAGGRPNPSLIAISPTGSSVALYEKNSRVLQLVSGLPGSPQIAYELDISAAGDDVWDIAVSDDAALALVLAGNESRTLWAIQGSGAMTPVSATRPSRIAFFARRPDALIADDATQEVFLLQGLDQVPVRMPGIVLPEGNSQFSAIAASTDGRSIYVAQQGSEDVSIVDLQTRETTAVSCHCRPTVFFPLKGSSVFRLNGLSKGPIMVLDASASNPRTLFIPVDPAVLAGDAEQ